MKVRKERTQSGGRRRTYGMLFHSAREKKGGEGVESTKEQGKKTQWGGSGRVLKGETLILAGRWRG